MGGRQTRWPCASCWRWPASTTRWRNCLRCRLSPQRSSNWRTKQGLGLSVAWSHCILGWVHYQRNELAAAEQCFRNLVPLAHAAHGRAVFDGYTGLVLTALAQGHAHEALADIAFLRELLLERGMLAFGPIAESLQQRVSLVCEPSSALDWRYSGGQHRFPSSSGNSPCSPRCGHCWRGEIRMTWRKPPSCFLRAEQRRRRGIPFAGSSKWGPWRRWSLQRRAEEAAALAALQEAVELAAPGGALRLLVDCGPGLIGLLQKLQAAGVAPALHPASSCCL